MLRKMLPVAQRLKPWGMQRTAGLIHEEQDDAAANHWGDIVSHRIPTCLRLKTMASDFTNKDQGQESDVLIVPRTGRLTCSSAARNIP